MRIASVLNRSCRSSADASTIRITVNTDVVVLGTQPVVPEYTAAEEASAIIQQEKFQLQQALAAYNAEVQRARELNKTIVNQNQLLYYIGYFEQARR